MKSSSLWTQKLTDKQLYIYDTIKLLRKEGLYFHEISHILNEELKLTSIRGRKFSSSLVHGIQKKIDKHMDRLTTTYYSQIKDVEITFEERDDEN